MTAHDAPEDDEPGPDDPIYVFKPSLLGAPRQFALRRGGLQWHMANFSGFIRYGDVRRMRMSYRPAAMQSHRFVTEIWSKTAPKLQIVSASWRSVMEQERLDAGYTAFVTELHRRLAAAGSAARFTTGMPVVSYWIGVVVFGGAMLALVGLTVRALQLGEWTAAALIGGLGAVFALQIGNYFRRNRPGSYRPEAVPANVLPRR
jgi:hypothetical protein